MKRCRYVGVLVLIATLLLSGSAFARKPRTPSLPSATSSAYQNKPIAPGATVWACAYRNTTILCRLWELASESATSRLQAVNPRLPSIVGDILNHPERLQGGVSIPLHTHPFDFELVGQLAEAVMCGDNPSCGVIFAKSFAELQVLVGNFEMARMDSAPLLRGDADLLAAAER